MNLNTNICYELNHTYLSFCGDAISEDSDYRFRMLEENSPERVLKISKRYINGDRFIYVDITEQESLLHFCTVSRIGKEDVKKLFRSLKLASNELSNYLIDNENLFLKPEFIFRSVKTGEIRFICIPTDDKLRGENPLMILFEYVLNNMDTEDTAFSEKLIFLYDAVQRGNVAIENIYDSLWETEEETYEQEEEQAEELENLPFHEKTELKHYKEWAVMGSFTVGVSMILYALCFW